MITKEMIDRINQLARKLKCEGLTEEEQQEQQALRKQYIEFIKGQVRQQLDCIEFVEEKEKPGCSCGCGGHGHDLHGEGHCECGHKKH